MAAIAKHVGSGIPPLPDDPEGLTYTYVDNDTLRGGYEQAAPVSKSVSILYQYCISTVSVLYQYFISTVSVLYQ